MNIFVGNLNYDTREDSLRQLFAQYGSVDRVAIISDKEGRSKGYGFVEMGSTSDGIEAIEALNNTTLDGRAIRVSEAHGKGKRSYRR